MQKAANTKTFLILTIALIFSMYQETTAQRKKTNTKTATVETPSAPPEISYTVSMAKPWTHLLEVEMRLKSANLPAQTEISMPVWTPGSYLVREYARHVESFTANDAGGNALVWNKIDKNTWRIDTKGKQEIVVK